MAAKRVHTSEQITAFLAELNEQTDRGAALIAGAVLDEILEVLITVRLLEVSRERHDALFGRGKPIDSFSAKIELAYQLGLISNAARIQLELVREVRNKFAHRIEPLKFDHPSIAEMIVTRKLPSAPKGESPRQAFIGVFGALAAILYGTAAADVRIRSLEETHPTHFLRMLEMAMSIEAAKTEKPSPPPDSTPASESSKP